MKKNTRKTVRIKPATQRAGKGKPPPRRVSFKGCVRADLAPKVQKPVLAPKPGKSRLIASEGKSPKIRDKCSVDNIHGIPFVHSVPKEKQWYALAVVFGFKDDKVRKAIVKLKKTIKKDIGRVISPKAEVRELKRVSKCTCPKEVPISEDLLPPTETPRGIRARVRTPYPRRVGECTCPKVPVTVKRKKFPGYLLLQARLTQEVLSAVQTTKGLECILMGRDNIVAVDTEEAAELLLERKWQNEKVRTARIDTRPKFTVGQSVTVIGDKTAAWFGQTGIVKEVSQQPNMSTKVEFQLLGLPVKVVFDARTLEGTDAKA